MIHLQLTERQRQELTAVSRQAVGRVALRAHMVLLSDRGYSVPVIALMPACGCDVVRTWRHRYAQHGVAGLDEHPRSGRPPKDRQAGPLVDAQARQSPPCSGHVQTCWRVGRLTALLARRFPLVLARASVRRALHRLGGRWARPRWAPARQSDPEAAAKGAALAQAAQAATQGVAHLLYVDERARPLLPLVRARWMKGPRVRLPTPGTNARQAFCGALEAVSGRWRWADHDRQLAIPFVAFRAQVVTASPTGVLSRALDGAPAHTANVVARWLSTHPRVIARRRPTYAAHRDNPAERIWGLLKDAVAANRLDGSIADRVRAARRFFTELAPHPVQLPLAA
jgi:transposase